MENKNITDQQLWFACRNNDKKAFETLFCRYAPKLLKQTMSYIPNSMIAEELVMDLMIDIWNKRQNNIMRGEVAPYLNRCMRNKILMHLRKNIPETITLSQIDNFPIIEPNSADFKIKTTESELLVENIVSKLSPKRQKIFRLFIEENLTCTQIAKQLNLSISTVENHLYDSRKILKKLL